MTSTPQPSSTSWRQQHPHSRELWCVFAREALLCAICLVGSLWMFPVFPFSLPQRAHREDMLVCCCPGMGPGPCLSTHWLPVFTLTSQLDQRAIELVHMYQGMLDLEARFDDIIGKRRRQDGQEEALSGAMKRMCAENKKMKEKDLQIEALQRRVDEHSELRIRV